MQIHSMLAHSIKRGEEKCYAIKLRSLLSIYLNKDSGGKYE